VNVWFCTNQSIIWVCTILQKPVHHMCLYDITKTSPSCIFTILQKPVHHLYLYDFTKTSLPFVSVRYYINQSSICVSKIVHKPVHYSKHHQSSVLLVHCYSGKHVFPWWWLPVCRRDAALVTVVLPHPGRANPRETNALRVWPKHRQGYSKTTGNTVPLCFT